MGVILRWLYYVTNQLQERVFSSPADNQHFFFQYVKQLKVKNGQCSKFSNLSNWKEEA